MCFISQLRGFTPSLFGSIISVSRTTSALRCETPSKSLFYRSAMTSKTHGSIAIITEPLNSIHRDGALADLHA